MVKMMKLLKKKKYELQERIKGAFEPVSGKKLTPIQAYAQLDLVKELETELLKEIGYIPA